MIFSSFSRSSACAANRPEMTRRLIAMLSTESKSPERMKAAALQAIQTFLDANPHRTKDIDDEQG